ncbi:MAG: citrate transporter [Staphylothermus sp.]|nr:citrate transporter [Staphylothermus sp.]
MYDLLVLTLLLLMIALVIIGKPERHYIGLIIVLTLLLTGALTIKETITYINWDVLGLILGMSIFSAFLEISGIAELIARILVYKIQNPFLLFFTIILSSGIISIALENVTVVLLFAPIVFQIGKITKMNITGLMIGIALASNMSGSATMIGDPPAIITAGYFNLSFMDFIIYNGKPSMFFITLIPMILSCLTYTYIEYRKNKEGKIILGQIVFTKEKLFYGIDKLFIYETLVFLSIKILLLSTRDILHIPLTLAALIGVGGLAITRIIVHKDQRSVKKAVKQGFEWKLLVFLAGVFALSGAFAKHGLAQKFAETILSYTQNNIFLITAILIWFSVAVSAVMDNTPYVVTMLPVIHQLSIYLNTDPITLAWALLLGATLGGGITYIGASANLVAVRLLEKQGHKITFTYFIKRSLPFNLVNIFSGWLLYIVFWLT